MRTDSLHQGTAASKLEIVFSDNKRKVIKRGTDINLYFLKGQVKSVADGILFFFLYFQRKQVLTFHEDSCEMPIFIFFEKKKKNNNKKKKNTIQIK